MSHSEENKTRKRVRFNNQTTAHSPRSPAYYRASKEQQQYFREQANASRNVEEGKNSNNIRRITRKRREAWSPVKSKKRANRLAFSLYGNRANSKKKMKELMKYHTTKRLYSRKRRHTMQK